MKSTKWPKGPAIFNLFYFIYSFKITRYYEMVFMLCQMYILLKPNIINMIRWICVNCDSLWKTLAAVTDLVSRSSCTLTFTHTLHAKKYHPSVLVEWLYWSLNQRYQQIQYTAQAKAWDARARILPTMIPTHTNTHLSHIILYFFSIIKNKISKAAKISHYHYEHEL